MILTDQELQAIHTKAYKEAGYPTIKDGLRAFMRGRKWATWYPDNRRPPRGIADKLGLMARVNKAIRITMIKKQEELKNEATKREATIKEVEAGRVNEVPNGAEK